MKKMSIFFSMFFLLFSMSAFSEENTGSIQVFIGPEECQSSFSFWVSSIENWSVYYPSETIVSSILPGEVEIRFREVSDWILPEKKTITVEANKTNSLFIRCCPIKPEPPIHVSAGDGLHTDFIRIQWNDEVCNLNYRIYRGITDDFSDAFLILDGIYGNEFRDYSAEPGNKYYYWVIANNNFNFSEVSPHDTGFLRLLPPTNIVASNGDYNEHVLITFHPAEGASEYEIWRLPQRNINEVPNISYSVRVGNTSNCYFKDTYSVCEIPYYYWIISKNGNMYSSFNTYVVGKRKMMEVEHIIASDCKYDNYVEIKFQSIDDDFNSFKYVLLRSELNNPSGLVELKSFGDANGDYIVYSDYTVEPGKKYLYRIETKSYYDSSLSAPDEGSAGESPNQATCFKIIVESSDPEIGSFSYWMPEIASWTSKHPSNSLICNLEPGQITIRFSDEAEWFKPDEKIITLEANKTVVDYAKYCPITPPPPLNVQASDRSSCDHILITWNSYLCDQIYEVYRGLNNDPDDSVLIAQNVNGTSYTDSSAEHGVNYYYWIVANNQFVKSKKSNYDIGIRDLSPPVDIVATNDDQNHIRISYNDVDGANEYEIWRGTSSDLSNAQNLSTVSNLYFDDKSMIYEKPYFYWIRCINPLIKSDFSACVNGKRKMPSVDFLNASDQEFEYMVKIKYKTIADDEYHGITYNLIRDDAILRKNKRLRSTDYYDGQFEDRTAYAGKNYYYRIKAQNAYGHSISGADVGSAKMSYVTGLNASKGVHLCKIRLDWNHVENAKFYYVYRNTTDELSTATQMESVTNLFWDNVNRSYFYWVKAVNEYTISDDSTQGYVFGYPATCDYNISVSEIIFDHNGGTSSFTVTPNFNTPECSWQISSSNDWIKNISPEFGTGAQTITFTIDSNNTPLTGTIDINGDNSQCNFSHSSIQVVNNKFTVSGKVLYFNNDTPIEGVKLTLEGGSNVLDVYTDENGAYAFQPSLNGNYHVTPSYTSKIPAMVITPFDASLLMRYGLNIIHLNSYQQLAADINGDGIFNMFDAIDIINYSIGRIDRLSKDEWLFHPITKYYSLDQNISDLYKGIVVGDVSGNWKPEGQNYMSITGDSGVKVELPDISEVTTGDQVQVPISITLTAGIDIYSYYAVITYDPEILTCTAVTKDMSDLENWGCPISNTHPAGKIRIASFGTEPLDIDDVSLKLHFTILGNINDRSPLRFETFQFNEGFPSVTTKDGSVSIVKKQMYLLNIDNIGNGKVLVNDSLETLPWKGFFSENENIQLEAIPSKDFYQWTGDLLNNNSSISILMNCNKQLKVIFNRFDYVLKKGWNLISLPVTPADNYLTSIFYDAEIAYEFKGGIYIIADRLLPGKGYWVKIPSDKTYSIGGIEFSSFLTEYNTGWNLIGATNQLSTPNDEFSTTNFSKIIEYSDGIYHVADQFKPGNGYWIKLETGTRTKTVD